MEELTKLNETVYRTTGRAVTLTAEHVDFLKSTLSDQHLDRIRICTHQTDQDPIHEMMICLSSNTYIQPHKHSRPESFHVIEGTARIILFDDKGNVTQTIEMGTPSSGKTWYYRLDANIFHTVIPSSDHFVFHETTQGPFDPRTSEYASWAPSEQESEQGKVYLNSL